MSWWDHGQEGYKQAELIHQAKIDGHNLFDHLWKLVPSREGRQRARTRAYAWLAAQLGIEPSLCHFGLWSLEETRRAQGVLQGATFAVVLDWWFDTHDGAD